MELSSHIYSMEPLITSYPYISHIHPMEPLIPSYPYLLYTSYGTSHTILSISLIYILWNLSYHPIHISYIYPMEPLIPSYPYLSYTFYGTSHTILSIYLIYILWNLSYHPIHISHIHPMEISYHPIHISHIHPMEPLIPLYPYLLYTSYGTSHTILFLTLIYILLNLSCARLNSENPQSTYFNAYFLCIFLLF